MTNFVTDAAAMSFVVSQTVAIERGVNETVYPDIQYPLLTPVDKSAGPFADSVTFYSSDKFGQARWINGNADDIPLAGTELASHKSAVYTAGIGYGFGWEEVNKATLLGIDLKSDDAAAARRAYEEFVENVALRGDAAKNFEGLINSSAVTAAAATTGNWGAATADQIVADINGALTGQWSGTGYTSMADTLLMPLTKFTTLATKRLGDTDKTVLEFIRANNAYTASTGQALTIRGIRGLDTAGSGSTARAVAYRRSPDVLKLHIPMPHRFLPAYQQGPLRWDVPGVFRMGGLDIRRPKEVRYMDGI